MTTCQSEPVVMPAGAIAKAMLDPHGLQVHATSTVLWHDDASTASVLLLKAGQRLGPHTPRRHHHHLWILNGEAVILGQRLRSGSYVHIPCGVEHDIDATDTDGCRVFDLDLEPPAN